MKTQQNNKGHDLTSSFIWRLTFTANVTMVFVSLSTVFWGVLPWFGLISSATSLAACVGMGWFKSKILIENLTLNSEAREHGRRQNDEQAMSYITKP